MRSAASFGKLCMDSVIHTTLKSAQLPQIEGKRTLPALRKGPVFICYFSWNFQNSEPSSFVTTLELHLLVSRGVISQGFIAKSS